MTYKRYQIWDKVSEVITPSGKVFTAEEWMAEWPMARLDYIKLVISGGIINGAFCGVFEEMVNTYEKAGCDFSNCTTDQDYLDTIEAFEDNMNNQVSTGPSTEERIAAALEAQVMLAMPDVEEEYIDEPEMTTFNLRRGFEEETEEEFSYVKYNYNNKLWSLPLVKIAVNKGIITKTEYTEITGREYN